jgi:uncharacterized protein YybS (DUF2232 family)
VQNYKLQVSIWLVLFIALSTSLVTPLGIIGYLFIPVALIVLLLLRTPRNAFSLAIILSLAIPAFLSYSSAWFVWAYVLLMLLPAVWMANAYKRVGNVRTVLTMGTLGMTISFICIYFILNSIYPDLMAQFAALIQESVDAMPTQVQTSLGKDFVNTYVDMVTKSIPMTIVLISFMLTSLAHTTTRRIIGKYGVMLPKLKVADEWRMSRSWVIIYAIAVVVDIIVPNEQQGFLSIALLNLTPLLSVAFSIQAIGFLAYLSRYKKWAKPMPILGIILYPAISGLIVLLGIFDIAFSMRKSLHNNEG